MDRSLQQLQQIALFADALPVAIWVGSAPSGEAVYVNRKFEEILGITPPADATRGNYVGPYGVHLANGEPYPEGQMPFERVMRAQGPVVIEDLVIHRHDGQRTFLRVFASPILDDQGQVRYVVEAFTDKTREVEADGKRQEQERQLEIAQKLDSIGQLAGGVAHDFNNLLAVVKLVASQLRQNEQDPVRLELTRHLEEVADSASSLTRSLLGAARRGKNLSQTVSVNSIAAQAVSLARRTFGARLRVELSLQALPGTIEGDAGQLEQVLMNLLINARDAIPGQGRIELRTYNRTVAPEEHPVLKPGKYLVLEVADTGGGIDPAVRGRLFEPYVTTKTSGPVKGTGLGLATVYGIAHSHGGLADVASTGPEGTVMRVHLPASEAVVADDPPSRPRALIRGSGTLLLVDDEPLLLRTTAVALRSLGYEVLTVSSGERALELVRERGESLVGILLDLAMPGMSGRETYLALRDLAPNLPVVLMTGSALNEEVQLLLDAGVRGFLPKPFDAAELSRALAEVVRSAG